MLFWRPTSLSLSLLWSLSCKRQPWSILLLNHFLSRKILPSVTVIDNTDLLTIYISWLPPGVKWFYQPCTVAIVLNCTEQEATQLAMGNLNYNTNKNGNLLALGKMLCVPVFPLCTSLCPQSSGSLSLDIHQETRDSNEKGTKSIFYVPWTKCAGCFLTFSLYSVTCN